MTDDKPIIHDDNHARALLLSLMREARQKFDDGLLKFESKPLPKKWNQKAYLAACEEHRRLLGDSLIIEAIWAHGRTKRKKTFFISLGGVDLTDEDFSKIKKSKLYPVTSTLLDSKFNSQTGDSSTLCYLSEHALVKMIRRSACHSMKDLAGLIRRYLVSLLTAFSSLEGTDDFNALTGESYMPCTFDEEGVPVVKSWISRGSWTPPKEAQLTVASDHLQKVGKIALIPVDVFSSSAFIDIGTLEKYIIA